MNQTDSVAEIQRLHDLVDALCFQRDVVLIEWQQAAPVLAAVRALHDIEQIKPRTFSNTRIRQHRIDALMKAWTEFNERP